MEGARGEGRIGGLETFAPYDSRGDVSHFSGMFEFLFNPFATTNCTYDERLLLLLLYFSFVYYFYYLFLARYNNIFVERVKGGFIRST